MKYTYIQAHKDPFIVYSMWRLLSVSCTYIIDCYCYGWLTGTCCASCLGRPKFKWSSATYACKMFPSTQFCSYTVVRRHNAFETCKLLTDRWCLSRRCNLQRSSTVLRSSDLSIICLYAVALVTVFLKHINIPLQTVTLLVLHTHLSSGGRYHRTSSIPQNWSTTKNTTHTAV